MYAIHVKQSHLPFTKKYENVKEMIAASASMPKGKSSSEGKVKKKKRKW